MKKNFLIAVLSFLTMWGYAQKDYVYITPFELANGSAWSDKSVRVDVNVNFSNDYELGAFDLWVPEGMSIQISEPDQNLGKGTILPFSYDDDDNKVYKHELIYNIITSSTRAGYVHYRVGASTSSGTKFKARTGSLCRIYVGAGTLKDGIYPIYITNVEFSYSTTVGQCDGITTYAKVGNPAASKKSLSVEKKIPAEIASSLATEASIDNIDLALCTGIPAEGIATKATVNYTRTVSDEWGTICLPFELTSDENIQYYAYESMTADELNVKAVETVAAGTPAVFKATTPGTLNWSSDNVAKAAINNGDMTGTYETLTDQTGMYFIAQNKFWYAEVPITIGSFRAYFPTSAKGASLRINVIDPNGIQKLEMDENGNIKEVFNLQGQHIAAPIKGQVNIINGKKVIVK